ncbi:MAG: rare lipoprotein A [Alteromonadaceae bacterium]|jgi:rare lipoprotein A
MLLINACSSQTGRYQQQNDSTPSRTPFNSELQDAIPRDEPQSRGGNKHYQVRGKHYQVLGSADDFQQTGTASWYGKKFHGHLTSNGEIYNMYSMSAAHKNVPLPTYLKVVNNDNNKSVIVRVNDRGPFHQSRIIDLSYSAAYKLDMLKTGTANVTITSINDSPLIKIDSKQIPTTVTKVVQTPSNEALTPSGKYIQVLATSNKIQAQKAASALSMLYQKDTISPNKNGIFRVLMGPFIDKKELEMTLINLKQQGYPNAFKRLNYAHINE